MSLGSFADEIVAARPRSSTSTSRFCGVCWDKTNKKWQVQIRVGGKYETSFAEEIDACQLRMASTCRATSRTKTKLPWSQKRRAFELLRRSERMLRA